MSSGIELIAAERERQITAEGWTPDHDDKHDCFEITDAAMCYLSVAGPVSAGAKIGDIKPYNLDFTTGEPQWPWEEESWKPSQNPIHNLVKAGALIVAEIERIQRREAGKGEA